jgi:hypothetical protein
MRDDHAAEHVVQEAYLRARKFFGGFQRRDGKAGRVFKRNPETPTTLAYPCQGISFRVHRQRSRLPDPALPLRDNALESTLYHTRKRP